MSSQLVSLGNHPSVDRPSITLVGGRAGVGWIVGPARRNGSEDIAAATIGLDGSGVSVLDPELRDETVGQAFAPFEVGQVLAVPDGHGGFAVRTATNNASIDHDVMQCATFSVSWPANRQNLVAGMPPEADGDEAGSPGGEVPASVYPDWYFAPFTCRASATTNPVIAGVRVVRGPDGAPQPELSVFVTRSTPDQGVEVMRLRAPGGALGAAAFAPSPRSSLRRIGPHHLQVIPVPAGWLVALRDGSRVRLSWLDAALRPVGAPYAIDAMAHGSRPEFAFDGSPGMMVVAARLGRGRQARHRVLGAPLQFGQAPGATVWLPQIPNEDPTAEDVAPTIASVGPGRWLTAWTHTERVHGERHGHHTIWAAVVGGSFNAIQDPFVMGTDFMDPEIVADGGRFLVVAFGRAGGETSGIFALPGQCSN